MKYTKLDYKDKVFKYISDYIRYDHLKEFLESGVIDDEFYPPEDYMDFIGSEDLTIINRTSDGKLYHYEYWNDSCWEGAYSKPEYDELDNDEIIDKWVNERMVVIGKYLGLELVSYNFEDDISTIIFNIKELNENKFLNFNEFINESKSEKYFGNDKDELLFQLEQDTGSDDINYLSEIIDGIIKDLNYIKKRKDVILYRLVALDSLDDLDYSNLGEHWVSDLEDLDYISNHSIDGSSEDLYVIKIKTPTTNIDFTESLYARCSHQYEMEVYLYQQKNIEIISVEKFKMESINESKSEKYFGLNKSELIDDIENSEMDLYEYDSTEEVLDKLYKDILKTTKKKKIKLYRIIWVKDEKRINKDKLGHHWVASLDSFHEEMIDYLYNNSTKNSKLDFEDDCYLITIETSNTNINLKETLIAQCNHPFEEEYYLESQDNIKILNIENFYN